MQIILEPGAKAYLNSWVKSENKVVLRKITRLIEAIINTPFEGIGKPEPLKYGLAGAWSGRINHEHRLIYEVLHKNNYSFS